MKKQLDWETVRANAEKETMAWCEKELIGYGDLVLKYSNVYSRFLAYIEARKEVDQFALLLQKKAEPGYQVVAMGARNLGGCGLGFPVLVKDVPGGEPKQDGDNGD